MSDDTLARWQFATTTAYHFLIVPISIGLTLLVAVMQTLAHRPLPGTGDDAAQVNVDREVAQVDVAQVEVLHLLRPQDFGPSTTGPLTSVPRPDAAARWIPPLSAATQKAGVTR